MLYLINLLIVKRFSIKSICIYNTKVDLSAFPFVFYGVLCTFASTFALVAELVDAPDLGSGISDVQVRVLSSAQKSNRAL